MTLYFQRATAMSVDGRQLPMPVQQAVSPGIAQASFNQDDILAQLNRNPQLRNMFANVDPGAFEVAMKMLSQMDPVMLGRLASGDTSILTQMCAKAGIDLL
ncbi:unnamed protein product [Owenia fusiformis]|uniref:Uncharacterized protein n=1 Tax=Owenia fusiformis TaxID=6347 RepID=A0A8S4PXJ1_OWEFU|nr:unnamed protein product [Owenia fusiformis]